jgi:hypothetical protein
MKTITNSDCRPKRKELIIAQKGASDLLLFNMDDGSYYALNELGGRIWELCDGIPTVAELIEILAEEYDAPRKIIEADVLELLENLRGNNLIDACGSAFTVGGPSVGRQLP